MFFAEIYFVGAFELKICWVKLITNWLMATLSHSPVTLTGNLASGTPAWDLRRSSSINGAIVLPLWRARFGATRRAFTVSAKIRKGKKREYPWPKDADPNVEGGLLRHLSPFKPLKEKPKPVILEFEKHLVDRQKTIVEVHFFDTSKFLL